jgi:heme O synthase-like polyprenyltransferase
MRGVCDPHHSRLFSLPFCVSVPMMSVKCRKSKSSNENYLALMLMMMFATFSLALSLCVCVCQSVHLSGEFLFNELKFTNKKIYTKRKWREKLEAERKHNRL